MAKYVLYILLIFVSWEGLAQNTSNLSGSFDIGPVGNATYNIPVDLPPGTAGLKPDISIVYNSFSGDGVMDVIDLAKLKKALLGILNTESKSLEGSYKISADINDDGQIDIVDLARMKKLLIQ